MNKFCTVGLFPAAGVSLPAPDSILLYSNNLCGCLAAPEQCAFQTGSCSFVGMWFRETDSHFAGPGWTAWMKCTSTAVWVGTQMGCWQRFSST